MQPEQGHPLVVALRAAAHDLIAGHYIGDVDETLPAIVADAVETIPGVVAGGISVLEQGRVSSRLPTSDAVTELDELQTRINEGPCITAAVDPADDGVILAQDLAAPPDAQRWPRFAPHAVERGYRSMMSTQLSTQGIDIHTTLNLYSPAPGTFDESARMIAGLFGAQAALLLYGAEHAAHMSAALNTRDVIGQAKGILMERFAISADDAFAMLVHSSQDTHVKLVDVARWLTSPTGARDHGNGGPGRVAAAQVDLAPGPEEGPGLTGST